jgi:hypothetical protein
MALKVAKAGELNVQGIGGQAAAMRLLFPDTRLAATLTSVAGEAAKLEELADAATR